MIEPTCKNLFNEEGFEQVFRESDDTYRHGSYITEVFRRESDDTYWEATYAFSTDGEEHGLRDGCADISQVEPYQMVITRWRKIRPRT